MLNVFYFTHLHAKMIPFLHKNSPQCHYFYRWLQPIYSVIIKHGLFLRDSKLEHSLAINSFLYHTPLETIKKKKTTTTKGQLPVELCLLGGRGEKMLQFIHKYKFLQSLRRDKLRREMGWLGEHIMQCRPLWLWKQQAWLIENMHQYLMHYAEYCILFLGKNLSACTTYDRLQCRHRLLAHGLQSHFLNNEDSNHFQCTLTLEVDSSHNKVQ